MQIKTFQFGTVNFSEENILRFKAGLFGFEELKDFLLIKPDDDNIFYWLYSIEKPNIGFPLIGLNVIYENYPSDEKTTAFGIVTMNKDPLKITVNSKAPVYINQDDKTGFQKIVEDEKYVVHYNLFIE
ncbi:MAG TPA: flagellar assembly protein FliW [Ignavibacteriaceae bacterium]|nr:flagellar assembly protein FliW [Ignavibacteriaceae bacterium]